MGKAAKSSAPQGEQQVKDQLAGERPEKLGGQEAQALVVHSQSTIAAVRSRSGPSRRPEQSRGPSEESLAGRMAEARISQPDAEMHKGGAEAAAGRDTAEERSADSEGEVKVTCTVVHPRTRRRGFRDRRTRPEVEAMSQAAPAGDVIAAVELLAAGVRHGGQSTAMARVLLEMTSQHEHTARLARAAQLELAEAAEVRAKSSVGIIGIDEDLAQQERAALAARVLLRGREVSAAEIGHIRTEEP